MMIESVKRRKLWKTKEKEISGLCTTGAETIGGYNLNGVYYSRDGQRLDDQPKKSWSQREYERAERENTLPGETGAEESEVDAQEIRSRTIRESKIPSQLL